MNKIFDVVIVGAGISGLSCAHHLSRKQKSIALLEARDRAGGRAYSITSQNVSAPIEYGSEFVHGKPRRMLQHLDDFKIPYYEVKDSHVYTSPKHQSSVNFWSQLEKLEKKMSIRKHDRSISQFVDSIKSTKSIAKTLFKGFVEGFHAADTDRISENYLATARDETGDTGALDKSFRMVDGYKAVIDSYLNSFSLTTEMHFDSEVKAIRWKKGLVEIDTRQGSFHAKQVVISVPIGVLKAGRGDAGWIDFQPRPEILDELLTGFEMGHVCKMIFEFKSFFWEKAHDEGFSFFHAGAENPFPTWWSLLPMRSPILIAWQGGPKALTLLRRSVDETTTIALKTLSKIVKMPMTKIRKEMISSHIHNWSDDPFSRGAYSYVTVDGVPKAKKLKLPFDDTLYFTGEALAPFPDVATMHGAMEAGIQTAKKILTSPTK